MDEFMLGDESWLFYRDLGLLAAEYPDAALTELEAALLGQEPQHSIYISTPLTKDKYYYE